MSHREECGDYISPFRLVRRKPQSVAQPFPDERQDFTGCWLPVRAVSFGLWCELSAGVLSGVDVMLLAQLITSCQHPSSNRTRDESPTALV